MSETILGLTCISEILKDKDKKKYSFRTMTRKRFNDLCVKDGRDETIKELSERILHNVRATRYIIRHCIDNNILHYRLSSSLFPLVTDETLGLSIDDLLDISTIKSELSFAGKIAKDFGISLSSSSNFFECTLNPVFPSKPIVTTVVADDADDELVEPITSELQSPISMSF